MMVDFRIPATLLLVFIAIVVSSCGNQTQHMNERSDKPLTRENLGLPLGAIGPLQIASITVDGITVTVEVAVTQHEQQQGLMYRTWMPKNHGMIFVYPDERFLSFWMSQTRLPLSIAFIRADGTIDVIRDMEPMDEGPRYVSRHRCQYALEMNKGWFDEHGVKAGDNVTLSPQILDAAWSQKAQANPAATE